MMIIEVLLLRESLKRPIEDYRKALNQMKLSFDGADLIRLGVKEGPEVGRILREIRYAWLEGKIHSPEEERELVLRNLP
jgi:tRNA nucleotidyltransferase (CCA-adding enzyme)